MSMKESPVEKYLVKQVTKHGGECYKLIPPPIGIQDRLVLLPHGYIEFVEVKRPSGGILADMQRFRAERTIVLGQKHRQINNKHEVDLLIQDWQNFVKEKVNNE